MLDAEIQRFNIDSKWRTEFLTMRGPVSRCGQLQLSSPDAYILTELVFRGSSEVFKVFNQTGLLAYKVQEIRRLMGSLLNLQRS